MSLPQAVKMYRKCARNFAALSGCHLYDRCRTGPLKISKESFSTLKKLLKLSKVEKISDQIISDLEFEPQLP